MLITIILVIIAFVLGLIVGKMVSDKPAEKAEVPSPAQAKQIMELFSKQERVTNDDVQKLLGVSDATAERYLDSLEKQNLLTQHGKTGVAVYYTLK